MYRVLAYRRTGNLGDAIQTVALCRLLGQPCRGVFRDEVTRERPTGMPFVVNGWLGDVVPAPEESCIFAGVHVAYQGAEQLAWLKASHHTIGARDTYTYGVLARHGMKPTLASCATLTFDRHHGTRKGRYTIDVAPIDGCSPLTNQISTHSWREQWSLALERLDQIRKAELVYTNRLHIILPCLAFGTPVVFPKADLADTHDKPRLTILDLLGFQYGEEVVIDIEVWAETYRQFLSTALNTTLQPVDTPLFPATPET